MSAPPTAAGIVVPAYGLLLVTDVPAAGEVYSHWLVWSAGATTPDTCCTYAIAWTKSLLYLLAGKGVVIETAFHAPGAGPCP